MTNQAPCGGGFPVNMLLITPQQKSMPVNAPTTHNNTTKGTQLLPATVSISKRHTHQSQIQGVMPSVQLHTA